MEIPLQGQTVRRLERIVMAFLALANVKNTDDWDHLKHISTNHALKTRDIIRYWNENFDENISESSYDDIRRKDLKLLVLSGIIISSAANPNAARNDGTRAFALNNDYASFSENKNWIYLIEAVHSSGAISPIRLLDLKKLTQNCKAELIFVTAFLDRKTFRKFVSDIAWETEVWIAESPDHLIHFDGEKFLGAY